MSDERWLRARAGGITGDVLHIPVATGNQGRGDSYATPLCDTRTSGVWVPAGDWERDWLRHAHWPVCARCTRKLDELQRRVAAHDQLILERLVELLNARQALEHDLERVDAHPTHGDPAGTHHRDEATS